MLYVVCSSQRSAKQIRTTLNDNEEVRAAFPGGVFIYTGGESNLPSIGPGDKHIIVTDILTTKGFEADVVVYVEASQNMIKEVPVSRATTNLIHVGSDNMEQFGFFSMSNLPRALKRAHRSRNMHSGRIQHLYRMSQDGSRLEERRQSSYDDVQRCGLEKPWCFIVSSFLSLAIPLFIILMIDYYIRLLISQT